MTTELYYLTLASVLTACQWVPYIFNQVYVRGLIGAMRNPEPGDKPLSVWATRAKKAHSNSIENLAPFGLLVFISHITGANNETTALAAVVYFLSRCVHYIVFVMGIPFIRTVMFVTSWFATMTFALTILQ